MQRGTVLPKGAVSYDGFQKVYETTLGATASSVTITGLNGDVDVEYKFAIRQVGGVASEQSGVRINNDSTAGIYGYQDLSAINTTIFPERSTSNTFYFAPQEALEEGDLLSTNITIYAKTGYVRTALLETTADISSTTVSDVNFAGWSYNDTSTNVTSLVLVSSAAGGLGIGTYIALYTKKART